ncbi:MAG: glycosyltransferase family 39 protein [Saprospiraceae bacterium]|nr:glycosyltransferase family 39 protein [Saprospiraceae bacterium]
MSGYLTVLAVTFLILCSLYFYIKANITWSLITILVLGFGLRVYGSLESSLHEWDERFHALVAKNLMDDPLKPVLISDGLLNLDYTNWSMCHVWLAKPPLAFWMMALSMKVLGVNEYGLRFPSLIFSILSIYLTFLIGKKLYNEKIGLVAAFLYAINGLLYEINIGLMSGDHVDTLFHLLFQLSVLLVIKYTKVPKTKYLVLIGVLSGLAFLCKWIMSLFILLVCFSYLIFVLKKIRETINGACIIGFFFVLTLSPWLLLIWTKFPVESKWMIGQIFTPIGSVIQAHDGAWYYYLESIRINVNEFIYLPLIFLIFVSFKRLNKERFLLLVWIFIPLMLLSVSETKRAVYLMMAATPLFIVSAWSMHYLYAIRSRIKYKWAAYLIICLFFAAAIRYSIERIKPFKPRLEKPEYRITMESLIEETKFPPDSIVLLNEPYFIESRFYYNMKGYRYIDDENILRIKKSGYKVFEFREHKYVEL